MDDIPVEILQKILKVGCDLEYEDICLCPTSSKYKIKPIGSYLKPFARLASQVSGLWRNLVVNSASFTITVIRDPKRWSIEAEGGLARALESTKAGDVDLYLYGYDFNRRYRGEPGEPRSPYESWLVTTLPSFQNRVRSIHCFRMSSFADKLLAQTFSIGPWRRLRALDFHVYKGEVTQSVEHAIMHSVPNLRFLNLHGGYWSSGGCPFVGLEHLKLSMDTLETTSEDWEGESLLKHISPSSCFLKTLVIDWSNENRFYLLPVMDFPSLTKLAIGTELWQAIYWLDRIRSPVLEQLQVVSCGFGQELRDHLFTPRLPRIKRLSLKLPENAYDYFFRHVNLDEKGVTDVVFEIAEAETSIRISDIKSFSFENLANIRLGWHGGNDGSSLSQFLDRFDFTAAQGHVCLDSLVLDTERKLFFPNAKKLTLKSRSFEYAFNFLAQISAPLIEHLTVPSFPILNSRGVAFSGPDLESQLSLQNLKVLELFDCDRPFLRYKPMSLKPASIMSFAPNITTLILSNINPSVPSIDYDDTLIPQVLNRLDTVILLKVYPNQTSHQTLIISLMELAREMVQKHKEIGRPIRRLRMNQVPPTVGDLEWLERNVDEFKVSTSGFVQSAWDDFDWDHQTIVM